MRGTLDATGLRAWLDAAIALVAAHRDELDALNVFPVADHDTGGNVLATLRSTGVGSAGIGSTGARDASGNSGLILTVWLAGVLPAAGELDAATLRKGLRTGAERARMAVARPVEGTMLSVADAAASAASAADGDLAAVAVAAAAAAGSAVRATREQLVPLRRAGVVDAGGWALSLVLDAMVATVTGRAAQPSLAGRGTGPPEARAGDGHSYEVQYTVRTDRIDQLRDRLDRIGSSLVTARAGPADWQVHLHLPDPGAAVEAALDFGRPRDIRIEALPPARAQRLLIAVGVGDIVGALLSADGVALDRGAGAGSIVAAAGAATSVVVLAAGDVEAAREAVMLLRRRGGQAATLVLRAPVQALAAVAVHDPAAAFSDAVVAMAEAAAGTRYGAVVAAERAAQTSAGRCRAGDMLGFAGPDVAVVGSAGEQVAAELLDRMLAGSGELVTLVGGATLVGHACRHLQRRHPMVEVQAHTGPVPQLWIGVE